MSSLTKFGSRLRAIGQKIIGGVRNMGQKISGIAMRLTPGLATITPTLGAATTSIAGLSGGGFANLGGCQRCY